jgi:aminoglycoside 3-N-acetyltransferase I
MDKELKIFRLKDELNLFIELVELLNEVFEEPPQIATNKRLAELLDKPDFYAVVAVKGNTVVGGLTAYELKKYYNNHSELYIYDIAVKATLHNQGVGKKLIKHLKELGTQNNIETIFVEALSEEEQAIKFYESTFGKGEKVDHFNLELTEK